MPGTYIASVCKIYPYPVLHHPLTSTDKFVKEELIVRQSSSAHINSFI